MQHVWGIRKADGDVPRGRLWLQVVLIIAVGVGLGYLTGRFPGAVLGGLAGCGVVLALGERQLVRATFTEHELVIDTWTVGIRRRSSYGWPSVAALVLRRNAAEPQWALDVRGKSSLRYPGGTLLMRAGSRARDDAIVLGFRRRGVDVVERGALRDTA